MSSNPDFAALRDLHNSANNLLHSQKTKKILLRHQQEKLIHEVSEASLRMLDACGNTKDVLLLVKDHIQQLQSTFRKASVGEKPVENKFGAYYLDRKNLKKQMLKRLGSFKRMKKTTISNEMSPIYHNLLVVVSVLKEVRQTTMSMLESLMFLMSMPSPNSSQIMWNKRVFLYKFMRVNSLSPWEKCDAKKLQGASERLEAVEIAMEDLEVELDCILRRLIKTRVLLLDILTN